MTLGEQSSSSVGSARRRTWFLFAAFVVASPVAAIPAMLAATLMFAGEMFGNSGIDPSAGVVIESVRLAGAAIYIVLIYGIEHPLVFGFLLAVTGWAFSGLATRTPSLAGKAALAAAISGVLYLGTWLAGKALGWDAGLFN